MASVLVLLKAQLDFFFDRTKGNEIMKTQGYNFMQISATHSPMPVLENSFSSDITRSPLSSANR